MTMPDVLHVGSVGLIHPIVQESMDEIMRDPRGLLLMWEPAKPNAKYIMSVDPTQGITGWSRGSRTEGDHKVDNAALEVFEVDARKIPVYKEVPNPNGKGYVQIPDIDVVTKRPKFIYQDVQVAEFAAPCDAVEIARIANIVGRIYAGVEEDQCELIYEAWPGPGILTTQELIRLGYGNLWMWEYIDSAAEETNRPGWRSTITSQRLLWTRARRHLMNRQAVIRSKWLLDEYSNAEIDLQKMRAKAAYGYHDDRFQAANMAFWAGHEWCYEVERTQETVTETPVLDFQRYAPTLDSYRSYKDYIEDALADWE